jgi:acyl-coenzyme A synthetase/AMP-(fatty) acid ligase
VTRRRSGADSGMHRDDVRAWHSLRDLAARRLHFVTDLLKTVTGKIQCYLLRRLEV